MDVVSQIYHSIVDVRGEGLTPTSITVWTPDECGFMAAVFRPGNGVDIELPTRELMRRRAALRVMGLPCRVVRSPRERVQVWLKKEARSGWVKYMGKWRRIEALEKEGLQPVFLSGRPWGVISRSSAPMTAGARWLEVGSRS
jgi:hypothetical protein